MSISFSPRVQRLDEAHVSPTDSSTSEVGYIQRAVARQWCFPGLPEVN